MVHLAFCGACPNNLMNELLKSKKLCNKIASFVEINMDFECIVDNTFLTKIAPYNTRLPKDKIKDHAGYKYIPTPKDKEIKASKFDLVRGERIGDLAADRQINMLVSLCACLKEKPYIQIQGGSELTK